MKKEGSCLPLSRLSAAPTTEPKALPFNCGGQEEKEQQNPTALLLVLALPLGSACSVLYLPLGPWGRCWKAVQWSWKLPPGWSRDSGYVSHEALLGRGLRLTSKSHQRHSGNKKKKKANNYTQKIADCYYSTKLHYWQQFPLSLLAATRHWYKLMVGGCTLEGWWHPLQIHMS